MCVVRDKRKREVRRCAIFYYGTHPGLKAIAQIPEDQCARPRQVESACRGRDEYWRRLSTGVVHPARSCPLSNIGDSNNVIQRTLCPPMHVALRAM